jgi:single-strand selective monofunctional uracil DNA glycosylase
MKAAKRLKTLGNGGPAAPTAELVAISRRLARSTARLSFARPVQHVYAPLDYAREPHEKYLALARAPIDALFLGMNPGPFGMVQTGVPFGEIAATRDFLAVEGRVRQPKGTHPKRPIEGFACRRSEVSGRRLWEWARRRWGSAEQFFSDAFVLNYCPLVWLEASGRRRGCRASRGRSG